MRRCFFCGEEEKSALEEHHIVPKAMRDVIENNGETIILCASCHRKLHYLLNSFSNYVTLKRKKSTTEVKLSNVEAVYRSLLKEPKTKSELHQIFGDITQTLTELTMEGAILLSEDNLYSAVFPPPILAFGDLTFGHDWYKHHWFGKLWADSNERKVLIGLAEKRHI